MREEFLNKIHHIPFPLKGSQQKPKKTTTEQRKHDSIRKKIVGIRNVDILRIVHPQFPRCANDLKLIINHP
jgi:hypothetical protein